MALSPAHATIHSRISTLESVVAQCSKALEQQVALNASLSAHIQELEESRISRRSKCCGFAVYWRPSFPLILPAPVLLSLLMLPVAWYFALVDSQPDYVSMLSARATVSLTYSSDNASFIAALFENVYSAIATFLYAETTVVSVPIVGDQIVCVQNFRMYIAYLVSGLFIGTLWSSFELLISDAELSRKSRTMLVDTAVDLPPTVTEWVANVEQQQDLDASLILNNMNFDNVDFDTTDDQEENTTILETDDQDEVALLYDDQFQTEVQEQQPEQDEEEDPLHVLNSPLQDLWMQGRFDVALQLCDEVLRDVGKHPIYLTFAARTQYLHAMAAKGTDGAVYESGIQSALILMQEAQSMLENNVELKCNTAHHVEVLKYLAIVTQESSEGKGNTEKLRKSKLFFELVSQALELTQTDSMVWFLRGRYALGVSKLSWAERLAAKVIYGSIPDLSYNDAVTAFEQARQLDPEWATNLLWLARAYVAAERKDVAVEVLDKLVSLEKLADKTEAEALELRSQL